jgi:hypothetical protein
MRLTGKDSELELSTDTVDALRRKWPTRDVANELAKMHLWLLRYPRRRPVNVWLFVENWLRRAPAVNRPPPVVNAWWTTDDRTINQGAAIGLSPRAGETMATFRDRIAAKVRGAA